MKILLTAFAILFSFYSNAQKVVKYYDKDWSETSRDQAAYYAEFIKQGNVYQCTSYYSGSKIVRGKSTFADTLMISPIGLQTLYNKKGKIEDSIYYTDGKPTLLYHYYANGKLAVYYHVPENKKEGITEAYDEEGKKIKNYIVQKEAEFKGGEKAWKTYLKKNIGKEFSAKKDNEITSASVQIQFVVDENGGVIKPKVFKSSGDKEIDRDALRVISESPEWNSAILYNKPVKAYRVQPFTYTLEAEKKSK